MKPDCDRYDAVVFDLFNTLVDINGTPTPHTKAWDYLGIPRGQWSRALFSEADRRLRGHITDPNHVIRDIVCKLDPTIAPEKTEYAARLREKQFRHALSSIHPHVLTTLAELRKRGKVLGLISNADRIEVSGWQQSEISRHFDVAIFSCQVGYIKPEPQIYSLALDQLGVTPNRSLFIGDGGNDELAGAKRAGMDTSLTLEFPGNRTATQVEHSRTQADFEIHRIDDLLRDRA